MRILFFCLVCLICTVADSHAQNNNSPYSIIGIGDIEKSSFDRTSGMGHAGLALSSNRFLYQANPASYSSIDEHFFYFEAATRFKSVTYSGNTVDPSQNQSTDLQFKKIALALKIKKRWAVSIGLLPFSTANYSFTSNKPVQGSYLTNSAYYEGSGSTNQFYLANSFTISKHLSIGIQASYLFGQFLEEETLATTLADSVLTTNRNISMGNLYFKGGFQYKTRLNNRWNIAIGATASTQTKLRANYALMVQFGNSTILNNQYYSQNYYTLPLTYTGGIAATYKNAYTIAADYNYQGWGNLNYNGIGYRLVNSQRLSVGGEYSKKLSYLNQVFEKYFLQTGFFYSSSYVQVNGRQLSDYGVTFGAGTQLARSGLGVQGALEIGQTGTTTNGLIKEAYTQFNITVSYRDFWISKKMKRYD